MIDVVQAVQASDPSLGTRFVVLRSDSRALATAEVLAPAAQDWLAAHAPNARLLRRTIRLAPYPGASATERTVTVLAFEDARHLAAFATAWTADPEPEEEEAGA